MRAHSSPTRIALAAVLGIVLVVFPACSDLPTETTVTESPELASALPADSDMLRNYELLAGAADQSAAKAGGLLDIVNIIVGFRDESVDSDDVASRYGIMRRYDYDTVFNGMAGTVSLLELPGILLGMSNDPDVAWVEPDLNLNVIDALLNTTIGLLNFTTRTLFGLLQTKQVTPWAIDAIDADRSWTRSGNGRGSVDVDVYVFDSGASHADLNVTECLDFTHGDVRPCGLISNLDLIAHGTAVSGAAAAMDNNKGVVGVVPGARVHALKVLGDDGTAPFSRVIAAIEYLTERKISHANTPMVANLSLGANIHTTFQSSLDRAVSASIDRGITFVVAAGNEGINAETISPAHVPEAITVGSFDENNRFSSFSNFGPVVDIVAPGDDVESLTSGNAVGYMTGTSIAAPYVTGAVALMLARHPNMSPAEVRGHLIDKARTGLSGLPHGTTNRRLHVRYLP